MIAPTRQEFWKKLMDYIVKNYEKNYLPVENTGPMAVTKFYESLRSPKKSDIVITDPCVFFPMLDNGKISKECDIKESYVCHMWNGSWNKEKWWNDPIIWNSRRWFYGLLIVYFTLWTFLMFTS